MSAKQNITAVIYDKHGRVLSLSKNSYVKTHPYQARLATQLGYPHRIYLHAEIGAILKCPDITKAYRIFVSRYGINGNALLAKPCPVCMEAIRLAGIKKVEYTNG